MLKSSERLSLIRPSSIRKMLELSAGMESVIHLEQGEPDFATPSHIVEAAVEASRKGFTHYTEIDGTMELRQAIADKLEKDDRISADPRSEVTVTSGSQEAMLIASLGFLNRGDEAVIIEPYYPAYFEDTLIAEAKPVPVALDKENGYSINLDVLEESVTKKTKMIWMCNPVNPTGHVLSRRDLENVAEVAKKHDLLVFTDEIYEKIMYGGAEPVSVGSFPGMEDRTITVNGFSKAYAMTGWRIGYVAADRQISATLRKLHYYMTLCPNAISQKAAFAALTGSQRCVQEMVEEYDRRRKMTVEKLKTFRHVSFKEPEGAFYVFPDFSGLEKSDEKMAESLLNQAGVVTTPGSGFGRSGQGHLRISYSAAYEQVEQGLDRIAAALQKPRRANA